MNSKEDGAECEQDPFLTSEECLSEEWIERAKDLVEEIQDQRFWFA